MGRIQEYSMVNCAVNPQAARERVTAYNPVLKAKRVLVIGGGVAGCEAARVLAERGHKPEIMERSGHLGGNLLAAGAPPFKEDDIALVHWYENEMQRLNVPVHFNTAVDPDSALYEEYDAVIVATGATPKKFPLGENAPVYTATDALLGKTPIGERVTVVDGGLVGVVDDAEVEGYAALGRRVREVEMDAAEGASDGGEGDGASRGGGPGVVVEVGSEPFGWGGAEGVEAGEPVAEGGEGVGVEGLQPGWDDVGGGSA